VVSTTGREEENPTYSAEVDTEERPPERMGERIPGRSFLCQMI